MYFSPSNARFAPYSDGTASGLLVLDSCYGIAADHLPHALNGCGDNTMKDGMGIFDRHMITKRTFQKMYDITCMTVCKALVIFRVTPLSRSAGPFSINNIVI